MKALILLICLSLLGSCASTPQSKLIRTNGSTSLPQSVELVDTPFYPQTQHQCGPAALATVLQAHGVQTTPEIISSQVYIPERRGSLQIEIAVSARRHNMLPYTLKPEMSDLFKEVAAGNPVLVLQNLGFEWYPRWHYAVVIGYDTDKGVIILRSGTTRRWVTPFEVFERTWQRAGYWALVIVPVGEIPETAEPLRYLKTAYAFEDTGNYDLAFKAYLAATIQWPDIAVVWTTLGNLTYKINDLPGAINAFITASYIDPASTVNWNNMAYALHTFGCKIQAMTALKCGLSIAPADKNLQSSWQELSKNPVISKRANCPVVQCY